MISKEYIQAWKSIAPWNSDAQVEQDLIISCALCELYTEPKIMSSLAFRGGTSLQKIFFPKPNGYSEDIDLVQIPKEGIGNVIDLTRKSRSKLTQNLEGLQVTQGSFCRSNKDLHTHATHSNNPLNPLSPSPVKKLFEKSFFDILFDADFIDEGFAFFKI